MRITQLQIERFMKLEAVEINPKTNTVMITGPNGAGKSSVLQGLISIFCPKHDWPEMPIKAGEETSVLTAKTEEFVAKLTIRKNGKDTLEVKTLEGAKYTAPQDFFNGIRGKFAFDPLAFSREEPKKQRQIFMDLLGLDFSDIRTEYTQCQQERAQINSNKGLLQQKVEAIAIPEGTPDKEVSISNLATDLQVANSFNVDLNAAREKLRIKQSDCVNYAKLIKDHDNNIMKYKAMLDEVTKAKLGCIEARNTLTKEIESTLKVLASTCLKDTTLITARIEKAEITNRNVHLKLNKKELQKAVEAKSVEYVELGHRMKELEGEKATRLSKVKMPVKGLSVSGDSVLHDGIPLSQVNTAKALEICIAISMALNPKLKVLWGNANDLDEASLKIIEDIAEKHGYQLWLEKVDTTGEIGFYIEEGKLVSGTGL